MTKHLLFSAAAPPFSSRGRCEPSLRRVRTASSSPERAEIQPQAEVTEKGPLSAQPVPTVTVSRRGQRTLLPLSLRVHRAESVTSQRGSRKSVRPVIKTPPGAGRRGQNSRKRGAGSEESPSPGPWGTRSGRALSQAPGWRFVQGGAALMGRRHSPRGSPATAPRSLCCPFPPRRHLTVLSNLKGHC